MPVKCKHCGGSLVERPLKGNENKTFAENYKEGTIIWKNLFAWDLTLLAVFIIVMMLAYGYTTDIEKCNDVIEDPYGFCQEYCEAQKYSDKPEPVEDNGIDLVLIK